jgi:hypothetical protein
MSKRVMIVCVMVVWPSGMVTLHNREGDSGELGTHDYNGETSYIIPQREFFGAISARHHGDIDAETADARATREAFRAAAGRYGDKNDSV